MNKRRYARRRKRRTVEAYTNAPLMNVRNQLMNKLGDGFDVIGGSTVPKIIITPDRYKNIQFEIQANGQSVEVMPVINSIPDYLHKRKGIAFMQAANVLYDFIMDTLKSVKTERFNRGTKLMIKERMEDTYFVGVSKKKNPGNTYDEMQTFNDEQEAWEFALRWNLKGYYVYWKEHTSMGWNDEIDYDYEDDIFEKTYAPYEMKRFSESLKEDYVYDIYNEYNCIDTLHEVEDMVYNGVIDEFGTSVTTRFDDYRNGMGTILTVENEGLLRRSYKIEYKDKYCDGLYVTSDTDYTDMVFYSLNDFVRWIINDMKKYFNDPTKYSDTIFTPNSTKLLYNIGYIDKGNYYIKDYVDCTIQIMKDQGHVIVYDENANVIYCPIKYVQSVDEIEELDNWGEFGGD